MAGPLVAVAVGWFVLAPPICDHSWPAIAFLIWTVLVVLWGGLNHGNYLVATGIVMLWFLGGAILAFIRFFIFLLDSGPQYHRCPACGTLIVVTDTICSKCGFDFTWASGADEDGN